jgi:hypothetical protein
LVARVSVAYVGLLARDALHMAGVDEIHVDARRGQDIIKGDPVVARAFHGGGPDAAF